MPIRAVRHNKEDQDDKPISIRLNVLRCRCCCCCCFFMIFLFYRVQDTLQISINLSRDQWLILLKSRLHFTVVFGRTMDGKTALGEKDPEGNGGEENI